MQGHVRVLSGVLSPPKATTSLQAWLHCASAGRDAPQPAAVLHSLVQNRALNTYTQPGAEQQEPPSCKDWGWAFAGTMTCGSETLKSQHQQEHGLQAFAQLTLSQQIWLEVGVNYSRIT